MICKICGCPGDKWLRVCTVAGRFQCSGKKVRRLILSGKLEGVKFGRDWRIDHASLDRLIREGSLEGQLGDGCSDQSRADGRIGW